MPDLLVRLYELPDVGRALAQVESDGVRVRRPESWERSILRDWIAQTFGAGWADECDIAFRTSPASCFVAVENDGLVGFACHDCTRPNFFGPTGVAVHARGRGIGRALLLACLGAMRDRGYAYAIIGGVGPSDFYMRNVAATPIERSTPGIYDLGLAKRSAR